jgi:hypothetical protein
MLVRACAIALAALAALPAGAAEDRPEPVFLREAIQRWRLQMDYHPIGEVVPEGRFRFTNFIRMHPSGFRADEYDLWFAPTYGLGAGWEVTAGVTGAERLGAGGQALFYGVGVQKQFAREKGSRPAVSVGLYGMTGPHDHHAGTFYLAATKTMWQRGNRAVFLHGGAKLEGYDSDDYGDGTGIRPYVGATVAFSRRFFLSGEFSPSQPWETADVFAIRGTIWAWRRVGVSGGIRNNGYETHPFVGLTF